MRILAFEAFGLSLNTIVFGCCYTARTDALRCSSLLLKLYVLLVEGAPALCRESEAPFVLKLNWNWDFDWTSSPAWLLGAIGVELGCFIVRALWLVRDPPVVFECFMAAPSGLSISMGFVCKLL